MIVLNTGGVSYRHNKEAQVGDIWKTIYHDDNRTVFITKKLQLYVEYYIINKPGYLFTLHLSDFYSRYQLLQGCVK